MPSRKNLLVTGEYYHIYVRSIAGYVVFNNSSEYRIMLDLFYLCKYIDFQMKFSRYRQLKFESQIKYQKVLEGGSEKLVDVISYCLMPSHVHLLLKQRIDDGISKYMKRVLNSYSINFNKIHKRNGPLWSSRFKNIRINNDEQLLHLTRYIHLNPTSAGLVENPEKWKYSSYSDYISKQRLICDLEIIDMAPSEYRDFVQDRKQYQKQLSIIKSLTIENYSG